METILPLYAQAAGAGDIVNDLARTPLSQVVMFIAVLSVIRFAVYPFLKNTPVHKRGGFYGFCRIINEILDAFVYAGAFVFLIIRPFALQTFRIPSGSMWPTLYVHDFIVANKAIYRYSDPKAGDIVVFRPPKRAVYDTQLDKNGDVNVDFIKRCIGTPGQVIELREGQLYRDGVKVNEPYKHYSRATDMQQTLFEPLSSEVMSHMTMANFKLVRRNGEVIPFNWTQYDANASPARGNYGEISSPYNIAREFVIDGPSEADTLKKQAPQPVPKGYYLMMGDNRNGSFDGRGWGLVPRESIIGRSEFIWLPFNRWGLTR
ncbi:MAG TPA: signal peptidase I [Fimbriimonas sp.]|nr:signal peptidase I [Fimbriimonas sp.]